MKLRKGDLAKELDRLQGEKNNPLNKALLTHVCDYLTKWTYNPDNLILNIPYFAEFFVRKSKLEKRLEFLNKKIKEDDQDNIELLNKYKLEKETTLILLDYYKEYSKRKIDKRKLKYGDQYIENFTLRKKKI